VTKVDTFNVIRLEHAEGIGAEQADRSVILQLSENAIAYHGGRLRPLAAFRVAIAEEAQVPVAMHLDHVVDPQLLRRTAEVGVQLGDVRRRTSTSTWSPACVRHCRCRWSCTAPRAPMTS
jgi:hypothetical protein